jgi:hypothetical protein
MEPNPQIRGLSDNMNYSCIALVWPVCDCACVRGQNKYLTRSWIQRTHMSCSSFNTDYNHANFSCLLYCYMILKVTPWRRVILNLIVAMPMKKFSIHYET